MTAAPARIRRRYALTCRVCDQLFVRVNATTQTCSRKCFKARIRQVADKRWSNHTRWVKCPICDATYYRKRAHRATCGTGCGAILGWRTRLAWSPAP